MRNAFYGTVLATLLVVVGLISYGFVIPSYGSLAVLGTATAIAVVVARRAIAKPVSLLAIAAGVVAGAVFWHAAPSIGLYPTVTLSVTGDKHPDAKGAEVWLTGVGRASGQFSVSGFEGWAKRDGVVVGYGVTAKTVQVPKTWQDGAVVRLGRSPYSGIVEVAVDDRKSRIDLYSAESSATDIPLPPPKSSILSAPFRILTALLFAWAVFYICAAYIFGHTAFRVGVVVIAILTATCVWLAMTHSIAGDVEFLAVGAPAPAPAPAPANGNANGHPATVFLGTAQGKVEGLPLPYANYQASAPASFAGISSLRLQTDSVPLNVWTQAGADASSKLSCTRDSPLVVEFDPRRAGELYARMGEKLTTIAAPAAADSTGPADAKRLFAVCWPYGDGLMVTWTSAYFRYNAWKGPVHAVNRVYLDTPEQPALMLRLSSPTGRYTPMESIGPGEYAYPKLTFPWNHAELARRLATALIAGLCVLLIIPIAAICNMVKARARDGRRVSTACVLAIAGVWMVATIVVGWPGIIGWDAISPVIQHGAGAVSLWYGVGYPLLVSALINLGGLELSLLLKTLIACLVVLWVALRALEEGASGWVINVFAAGMFLLSGTTMVAATELRDAVNGVVLSGFGLLCYVLFTGVRRQSASFSPWHYAMIALLGTLLVLLRTDNIVYVGVLLCGFAFVRPRWRNVLACLSIVALWLAATPLSTRYVMERGDHGKAEMRLYKVSAFVNPLVGMLRGEALTRDERLALSTTLDKVLKVDYSVEHWTPSDVIYWHQSDKGSPSPETLAELQRSFIFNALHHPLEFFTLRTATFVKSLGMNQAAAWLAKGHIDRAFSLPPYFDHLGGQDTYWRSMVALAGYRPAAHLFPELAAKMYAWYEGIAFGALQLLCAVALMFGFRRHPAASLLAVALIARAGLFWLMQPASVFLYLSELQILGTLLPLLAWIEWRQRVRGCVDAS